MSLAAAPDRVAALSEVWSYFAEHEFATYSPLYAAIARHVAGDEEVLQLILRSPPAAHQPTVILAAVHYLLLGGLDHPLASLYREPGAGVDAGPLFRDVCLSHRDEVLRVMETRRTQTNECGRSAPLALGLCQAAAAIGEPLAVLDAGASAGLNLLFDRYLLDFGDAGRLGPAGSPVIIRCPARGELPVPARLPAVGRRVGLDRSPVDLTDPEDARWLLACVWPDTGRLERTAAAVDLARVDPPLVHRGDMVGDLAREIDRLGDGPVAVVTSWSYSYLSVEEREGFRAVLAEESRRRPVAWVSADAPGVVGVFDAPGLDGSYDTTPSVLGLAVYRDGAVRGRPLALVHSHGAWIRWLAGSRSNHSLDVS